MDGLAFAHVWYVTINEKHKIAYFNIQHKCNGTLCDECILVLKCNIALIRSYMTFKETYNFRFYIVHDNILNYMSIKVKSTMS